jgi:predicted ATPase/DNA-binding CsgD family transcriptional regulator
VRHPHNLPSQVTSFVGRELQIAEARELISKVRLVTMLGPGGCGKTRLALEVISGLLADYQNGVWLVELAAVADSSLVGSHVAFALAVQEIPGQSLESSLEDWLRHRELLLVLDNCEHLTNACARLVHRWLRASPGLRVLATSRESLKVPGEATLLLPPLSLPEPSSKSLASIRRSEAVRLFAARASLVKPGYDLTDDNKTSIIEICRRLDGMPLAIELAASRVRVLSERDLLDRLEDRFRLLTRGGRILDSRHQTLRATVDWSYRLLSSTEQLVFRRLAVFLGNFTLADAEAVCQGNGVETNDVLDVIESLVDKSMIVSQMQQGQPRRCNLLETLRQYGQERLIECGEMQDICRRHASHFRAVAEKAQPGLRGPEQGWTLNLLETEQANFRGALTWAASNDPELGLELATALADYWGVRGPLSEASNWLTMVLARVTPTTELRARGLVAAASIAWKSGDFDAARSLAEEGLVIARDRQSLTVMQDATYSLSVTLHSVCEFERARALAEDALALAHQLGDKGRIASALWNLQITCYFAGDVVAANTLGDELLRLAEGSADRRQLSTAKRSIGLLALDRNDLPLARSAFAEGLRIRHELRDRVGIAYRLEDYALLAFTERNFERGFRLAGAAQALRESVQSPAVEPWQRKFHAGLSAAQKAFSGRPAIYLEQGRRMELDHAVGYALGRQAYVEPAAIEARPRLTEREHEVIQLLTRGLTNRQIAERLAVGERTIDSHVEHVRNKLGVRTRAEIASWLATKESKTLLSSSIKTEPAATGIDRQPQRRL